MTEEKKIDNSTLPEVNWEVEYEQLSEDFRLHVTLGWQAPVTVLAVDGVIIGSAVTLKSPLALFVLFLIAGIFTITMGLSNLKWTKRNISRAKRLERYDHKNHFERFYPPEKGFLTWSLGTVVSWLMMLIGAGMISYACCIAAYCLLHCHFII